MSPALDRLGWVLLHFLWQGTAIAFAAAVALWLLRGSSARMRYLAAWVAMITFLLVPAATWSVLATPRRVAEARTPQHVVVRIDMLHRADPVLPGFDLPAPPADSGPWRVSLHDVLVKGWLAAVVLLSLRGIGGLWRVRQVYRAAAALPDSEWSQAAQRISARLGVSQPVRVVDADFADSPTLLGSRAPIVALPTAAISRLNGAQVEAILAHELAHVRRHDYIANLVQTACETALCHHPAAWWLSRRIRAEREHCCDDVAIALSEDRVGYAEALTELETSRTAQPRLALAITGGGSLLKRIRHVLTPVSHGHRAAGIAATAVLVAACVAVVGAAEYQASTGVLAGIQTARTKVERVVMIGAVRRAGEFPTPAAPAVPFDVVSVNSTSRGGGARLFEALPGGRFNIVNYPLRDVIRSAYQLQPHQLIGGPEWLANERFDIAAIAPGTPPPAQMLAMLRRLLAERFGLVVHPEAREMPVYLLVARPDGHLGPRLQPAAVECGAPGAESLAKDEPGPSAGADAACRLRIANGSMAGGGISIESLARRLGPLAGRPVVDRTRLSGGFDFDLTFAADSRTPGAAPSLFTAVEEQLGLRLQPERERVDVLVIDDIRRPIPN